MSNLLALYSLIIDIFRIVDSVKPVEVREDPGSCIPGPGCDWRSIDP